MKYLIDYGEMYEKKRQCEKHCVMRVFGGICAREQRLV